MIRKLILSAVIATGAVTGLALTPGSADARPPEERFHHRFEVVGKRGCGAWHVYGVYRDRCDADREAAHLRHHGYFVEVRGC